MIIKLALLYQYYFNITDIYNSHSIVDANLIVSGAHAYLTFIVSVLYLLNTPVIIDYYPDIIYISAYYSIYDIYIMHKYDLKNKISMSIHHGLIVFALSILNYYYYYDISKNTLVALNYLTELSTPFLNKSTILYNKKMTHHPNYIISTRLLIITFFVFRIMGGVYYVYMSTFHTPLIVCAQVTLTSLNFIWFYKIIKMINKT
jgi:hypothetical protein